MALVPQSIALYDNLSVQQNLDLFAALQAVPRAERAGRVDAVIEQIGLGNRKQSLVRDLSGGMQRALNIGVALLNQPKLLILDEPTAGIDVAGRAALHDLINDLKQQGTAILFTTHDLDEARALADDLAILRGGEVVDQGAVSDLAARLFAGRKRLVVQFAQAIDSTTRAKLTAIGLAADDNDQTQWHGLVEWDRTSLQRVSSLFRSCVSLSVEQPDLEDLLTHHQAVGGR